MDSDSEKYFNDHFALLSARAKNLLKYSDLDNLSQFLQFIENSSYKVNFKKFRNCGIKTEKELLAKKEKLDLQER